MLEYDRIHVSEGIDINKTKESKECDICHYWYFLDKDFKYKPYLCNGCHDLMQKAMNFNYVVIVSIKWIDYKIHFWYMGKDNAINIIKNSDLNEKSGLLLFFFLLYKYQKKMSTYYQRNREKLLNRAKEYYRNNKERLREQVKNKYR